MLLPLITVLGLTGCSYVLGPAVSERDTPYPRGCQTLPKIMRPFSLGRHLKLTRMGNRRTKSGIALSILDF